VCVYIEPMDVLAGLLDGPRARGAFLIRSIMEPPWSMRIEDESPLTLVAIVRGWAWVIPEEGDPVRLQAGDVAIARGPDHYTIADDPVTPPHIVIRPGQDCTTLRGEPLAEAMDLGVRTWGNDLDGSLTMLTGTYETLGEISQRLLDALPSCLVVPGETLDSPFVPLLSQEMTKTDPGQQAVLDRLLDLLLISTLRAWFSRPQAAAPAWYRAYADPVVGRALRMLENEPARPWTVATLAAEIGLSRAALARRFTDLVGEPPMTFLANWRLALAADLLREPDATVGAVARQVGYGSPFALSTAFKRVHGSSPRDHRDRHLVTSAR
jgi:AraC-like DNA-binding protein